VVIGFTGLLQKVTTNNYDSLTEIHIPKITITTVQIIFSYVFTSRCLVAASTTDVPLPLGSPTVPGLSYSSFSLQLLTDSTITQSQSYFTTGRLPPIISSWRQTPWDSRPEIFFETEPSRSHPGDGSAPYEYTWPSAKCTHRTQL
jgi:hypothetical protein